MGILFTFDETLLILRLVTIVVLYLFVLQVVLVARRDLRFAALAPANAGRNIIGHLIVVDSGPTPLVPGARLDLLTTMSFGRGPTNTVVLDSNFVSTEHARLYYRDRSLWVDDLGSRNGTYVNEKRVEGTVAVKPGDILRVGDVRFKLAADSREPSR